MNGHGDSIAGFVQRSVGPRNRVGAPDDVLVLPDGMLPVSDGAIYRIKRVS